MSKFVLRQRDDETLDVYLNGIHVAHADHDADGWAGMRNVEDTVRAIARELGIPVTETYGDEEA